MKDSPCHGCTVRFPCCHSSCERYKEWKAPLLAVQAEKQRQRKTDEVIAANIEKTIRKYRIK